MEPQSSHGPLAGSNWILSLSVGLRYLSTQLVKYTKSLTGTFCVHPEAVTRIQASSDGLPVVHPVFSGHHHLPFQDFTNF